MNRIIAIFVIAAALLAGGIPAIAATRISGKAPGTTSGKAPGPTVETYRGGAFLSVVTCSVLRKPPAPARDIPSQINLPSGRAGKVVQGKAELHALTRGYIPVETCTVTVMVKSPVMRPRHTASHGKGARHRSTIINTGFGGAAAAVSRHHPAP